MGKNKNNRIQLYEGQQLDLEKIRKASKLDTVEFNDNIWVSNPRIPNLTKNPGGRSGYVRPDHKWNILDYLSMVPFAVAATPLVTAAGEAAAGTAAGQAVTNFLLNTAAPALARSKALPWINAGLTSVFGAPHAKKVVEGDINNVDEALEAGIMLSPLGLALRPMANATKTAAKTAANTSKELANKLASDLKLKYYTHSLGDIPTGLRNTRTPLIAGAIDSLSAIENFFNNYRRNIGSRTLFNRLLQRFGHTPTMDEIELFISLHPEVSIRGILDTHGRNATIFETETPEQFIQVENDLMNRMELKYPNSNHSSLHTTIQNSSTPLLQTPQLEAPPLHIILLDPALLVQTPLVIAQPIDFRTRTPEEVEKLGRWRREQLFDSNGRPLGPFMFDYLDTGAHGHMIDGSTASPEDMWRALADVTFNTHKDRFELTRIRRDNPAGRSGVLIHSHVGDLSSDSHPLAHAMISRLGINEIVPIDGLEGLETANNFGSTRLYLPKRQWRIDPYVEDFIKSNTRPVQAPVGINENGRTIYESVNEYNPYSNLPFDIKKLSDGSLELTTPRRGRVGLIPARTAKDVLENSFNKPIRMTNLRFKINLPEAELTEDAGTRPQFTFGRSIKYPIFGRRGAIGLKRGGRVKLIKRNK